MVVAVGDISNDALAMALGSAYRVTEQNVLNYVCATCVSFLCTQGVYPPPPVLRRQSAVVAALHDDDGGDEEHSRCTFAAHAAAALAPPQQQTTN